MLLADLFDAVSDFRYEHAKANGGKPKKPKRYPRPWAEDKQTKHIGKDPIPVTAFDEWWDNG